MSRRRAVLAALALVAGLSLCGCATTRGSLSDLPVKEYAGHYTSGDKESWFRPCGAAPAERPWWVTFTEASVAQLKKARESGQLKPGTSYFVRWKAAVTMGGEVGPQGPGVPALLVRELLEVRPAAENDCAGIAAAGDSRAGVADLASGRSDVRSEGRLRG